MRYIDYWKVESDSSPGKFHNVSRSTEGEYACSCIGWTRHTPRRDCRHIVYVKAGAGIEWDPMLRAMALANRKAEAKAKP